jgi:hypothetical protein
MKYQNLLALTLSTSLLTFVACTPADQDGTSSSVAINGVSEDGYVSGGIVWHDVNDNKTLDGGEPFAITDEKGYFSKSIDGVNYCADETKSYLKRHCLKVNVVKGISNDIIIRIQKGQDIITTEPFLGSITLKATIDKNGKISDVVATPITTLLAYLTPVQVTAFANRHSGLTETDLKSDFLDFIHKKSTASEAQIKLIKGALQVHKTVELVNSRLRKIYTDIGKEGFPADASSFVYQAIIEAFIAQSSGTLSHFMSSSTKEELGVIFSKAENLLRTAIEDAYISTEEAEDLPSEIGTISWNKLATKVHLINTKIGTFIGATGPSLTNTKQIRAESKVIEIIKGVIKKGVDSGGDGGEMTDDTFKALIVTVNNELENIKTNGDSLNVAKAIENENFTGTGTYRDSAAQIFIEGEKALVGNNLNLNTASSFGKSQALIYFRPFTSETRVPNETTSGLLSGCLKFDDGDDNKKDYRETKGSFISGYWIVLNNYMIQLNASIGGKKKTIILKSNESMESSVFRFSTDISGGGETRLAKLEATVSTIPTSNTDCEELTIPEVSSK